MNERVSLTAVLLLLTLAPIESRADLIDISDIEVTAFASFNTQRQPERSAFDVKSGPASSLIRAEVLVLAGVPSTPFPNLPTGQTQAFGSSAGDTDGNYAVGASGFFFRNSLPPNATVARGTSKQTITNNSEFPISGTGGVSVPAPTIQFFGVGNSFPPGADPALDATAAVSIRFVTTLTHPDGSTVETVHLDYGIRTFRLGGFIVALPTSGDGLGLTRFDEPDGSFGFRLPDLEKDLSFGNIGPGDTLEVAYDFFAEASTGFGETGVFAAIGDPFDSGDQRRPLQP